MCSRALLAASTCALIVAGGCRQQQAAGPLPPELPVVPVSQPVRREVTDYVDYTGRTDATQTVSIRARVTGYLVNIPFKEGSEVKKGQLLFEIDPRPYQALLDQATAQVTLNNAQLALAKRTYDRDRAASGTGAVSQQDVDRDKAAVDEAEARIKASQAAVEIYKLNLEFTKVTSPIDGIASRYFLTVGNLVNQDQTLLTTVVAPDPMYAYFDMDEPTLRRIKTAIIEGRIALPKEGADVPVLLGLQGEEGFPHKDGKKVSLSGLKGKVVLVDFWATWCGPCVHEIPHEIELANKLDGKPFAILGVSADHGVKDLRDFEKSHMLPWKNIFDAGGAIAHAWGIEGFPTVFLIDHKGVIRHQWIGAGQSSQIEEKVEELVEAAEGK